VADREERRGYLLQYGVMLMLGKCSQGRVNLPSFVIHYIDDLIARLNRGGYIVKAKLTTLVCWQEGNSRTRCRSSCRGLSIL
jgi:hypothetical protein